MVKSVIYFHGLESPQGGIKVEFLDQEVDFLEAPAMDYTQKDIFEEWLDYVKTEEPDLLIGSSMGGYFAMALSSHTGIPVLVFNPAIHSRSIEIDGLGSGTEKLKGLVVLGKNDNTISPDLTFQMLKGDWNDLEIIVEKNMGHRVPLDIFIDMYNKMSSNEQTK
jgi:pimeloyl-ACP methyl ester carboxylesterase